MILWQIIITLLVAWCCCSIISICRCINSISGTLKAQSECLDKTNELFNLFLSKIKVKAKNDTKRKSEISG